MKPQLRFQDRRFRVTRVGGLSDRGLSFFFTDGLGVKVTAFWAGRAIFLPEGRVIHLGAWCLMAKTPKRRSSMREPETRPVMRLSRKVWTILPARFRERPKSAAMALARLSLITRVSGNRPTSGSRRTGRRCPWRAGPRVA